MLKHFQRKHKSITGLEGEYECQDCNAKFSSKTGLGRHRSNKHTENSPNERVSYQCKYCQKPFADQSCLRRHIKHDHEEEATYGCGLCYHIAASKEDMSEHCEVNGHDLNRSYKISDSQLCKF